MLPEHVAGRLKDVDERRALKARPVRPERAAHLDTEDILIPLLEMTRCTHVDPITRWRTRYREGFFPEDFFSTLRRCRDD